MYASYELILLTRDGKRLNVAPSVENNIITRLTKLTGYRLAGYPGNRWEVFKWPEYVNHMKQISRRFNDIVFLLNREGEMPGDLKKEYFYRGAHFSDVARIEFKEPSESIGKLVNEVEKQSESRSIPVTTHELDKLQTVTG
jgi:hypothetical protein